MGIYVVLGTLRRESPPLSPCVVPARLSVGLPHVSRIRRVDLPTSFVRPRSHSLARAIQTRGRSRKKPGVLCGHLLAPERLTRGSASTASYVFRCPKVPGHVVSQWSRALLAAFAGCQVQCRFCFWLLFFFRCSFVRFSLPWCPLVLPWPWACLGYPFLLIGIRVLGSQHSLRKVQVVLDPA